MLETRRLHHSGHRADVSSRLRRRVAARRSKSASCEKRFISTAHSTRGLTRQLRGLRAFTGDGHDAPVESGAVRRLRRTSASHMARRRSTGHRDYASLHVSRLECEVFPRWWRNYPLTNASQNGSSPPDSIADGIQCLNGRSRAQRRRPGASISSGFPSESFQFENAGFRREWEEGWVRAASHPISRRSAARAAGLSYALLRQ